MRIGMASASLALAQAQADMSWEEFKNTYGRVYNGDEETARKAIFEDNLRYIQEENAKNASYTLAVNMFADLTIDEFTSQYTGLSELPSFGASLGMHEETEVIGDEVDWVAKGAVNPVKNQGSCGSCWAFSTVGTLESAYQIATGQLLSLAEQQLVDCDRSDDGCNGGWPHTAYDSYYTRAGVCTEASYTYTASGGYCRASSCDVALPQGSITGHRDVGRSTNGLKSAVFQQPISVTVNAGQLMQFYNGGVVTGRCQGQINHAVIAVGYGMDGQNYFKIRNSWGASWGEAGYIRLAAEGGSQGTACLLQYPPVYPTLADGPVPPSPVPTPTPSPPTPSPTPTPTPGHCHAISALASDDWCETNCHAGFCPADLCKCDSSIVV